MPIYRGTNETVRVYATSRIATAATLGGFSTGCRVQRHAAHDIVAAGIACARSKGALSDVADQDGIAGVGAARHRQARTVA
jgi:hypothetical protein